MLCLYQQRNRTRNRLPEFKQSSSSLTATLAHQGEVSSDWGVDGQGQGHDGEGHSTAAFRGCATDHWAEDHGDGHLVAVREEGEVVVSDCQGPPGWNKTRGRDRG